MQTISVTHDLKWQIKGNEKYKWTSCKKLFNTQTGRQIKKTMNCRSVGYWIGKQFNPLSTQSYNS